MESEKMILLMQHFTTLENTCALETGYLRSYRNGIWPWGKRKKDTKKKNNNKKKAEMKTE